MYILLYMLVFFTRFALNKKYCKLFETTSLPHLNMNEKYTFLWKLCLLDNTYPRKQSEEAIIVCKEILDEVVKYLAFRLFPIMVQLLKKHPVSSLYVCFSIHSASIRRHIWQLTNSQMVHYTSVIARFWEGLKKWDTIDLTKIQDISIHNTHIE